MSLIAHPFVKLYSTHKTMISAQDVKKLRDITGAGMMDCKKALTESNGDFDAAVDFLRKQGQKVAAKRADREAKEGVVNTAILDGGKTGVMVEVNCETDFVARNEDFQKMAQDFTQIVIDNRPADMEALKALTTPEGITVAVKLDEMTGKIGEKIDIRRFAIIQTEGQIVEYVHPGARLAVLVDMNGGGDLEAAGKDLAMQIAAMNPISVSSDEVPQDVQDRELDVARELARNEGKPEAMLDKIAEGRLRKFFQESVLLEQAFVKDAGLTVKEMLKKADANVSRFVRFALAD